MHSRRRRHLTQLAALSMIVGGIATASIGVSLFARPATGGTPLGNQDVLVIPIGWQPCSGTACAPQPGSTPYCPDPKLECPTSPNLMFRNPRNSPQQLQSLLSSTVTPFWSKASYGQTNFRFTVLRNPNRSDGWFPPPKPLAVYSQGAWDIPSTVKHPEYYEPFVPAVTKDVVDTVCANASLAATLGCGPGATQFPRKFGRLIVMSNWADFGGQTIGSNYPYKIDTSTTHNWTPTATVANEDSFDRQMVEVVEHELGHQLGTDAHYGRIGRAHV